jgi:hypothetical protein
VQALRQLTAMNSSREGAEATAQDGVGAFVEQLERWDHAATTDPDEGGGEELGVHVPVHSSIGILGPDKMWRGLYQ